MQTGRKGILGCSAVLGVIFSLPHLIPTVHAGNTPPPIRDTATQTADLIAKVQSRDTSKIDPQLDARITLFQNENFIGFSIKGNTPMERYAEMSRMVTRIYSGNIGRTFALEQLTYELDLMVDQAPLKQSTSNRPGAQLAYTLPVGPLLVLRP